MKSIAKDNTKLIRKENTKCNFSTIKNSIKYDLRLSPTSRLIMLEVFSNSDDFAYSESYFLKFLGITKKTYYKYRDELIKFGYLKINSNVKNPNLNYYIFSEFGNLNNNPEEPKANPEVTQNNPEEPKANPEVTQNNPEVTQNNPELCTIDDIQKYGYDLMLNSIVEDLSKKRYIIDVEKILDMFLTKITKDQLEKGIDRRKLEKAIILKCSTKPEKITDKEIKEMVIAKGEGLTKMAVEGLTTKVIQRYNDNPQWTKKEVSQCILRNIIGFRKPITSNQD